MASQKKSTTDYEALGKALYSVSDVYADKKKLYRVAFIKGLVSGLGGVIGATLLVGLLLWLLSLFNQVPLIGPFTDRVKDTVEQAN